MKDSNKEADFYINKDGNTVFTQEFHLRRGYCCESGCKHCPYGFGDTEDEEVSQTPLELRKKTDDDQISDEDLAEYYLTQND